MGVRVATSCTLSPARTARAKLLSTTPRAHTCAARMASVRADSCMLTAVLVPAPPPSPSSSSSSLSSSRSSASISALRAGRGRWGEVGFRRVVHAPTCAPSAPGLRGGHTTKPHPPAARPPGLRQHRGAWQVQEGGKQAEALQRHRAQHAAWGAWGRGWGHGWVRWGRRTVQAGRVDAGSKQPHAFAADEPHPRSPDTHR